MLCFSKLVLKLVLMYPLRKSIKISAICNRESRIIFLKPDTVCIIREGVTMLETSTLLRPFNGWRTLVGRESMILMPVIGAKFIWQRY